MISPAALVDALLTPLWAFLLHILLSRSRPGVPRQKLALFCCVLAVTFTTMSALVLDWISGADGRSSLFVAFVSAGLAHVYFHFFNMSETARRIRLIVDLARGRVPAEGAYDNRLMVEARLSRLAELRQIRETNGKLHSIPGVFIWICRVVRGYEKLLFPSRFIASPLRSEGRESA